MGGSATHLTGNWLVIIAAGLLVGVLVGMISVPNRHSEQSTPSLLPTVAEELNQNQYELILAQPHGCQDYLYLEDQIEALQLSRRSMQEIKSEIVLEQLDAIDQAIERLEQAQEIRHEITQSEIEN